jgi:DNA repair exonuclease SbcCD ATPase subunit
MAERPGKTSISAIPDDVSGRRSPVQGGRRRTPKERESRTVGLNVMLAVLVAGLVVAGWFIANQHQLLIEEAQALEDAKSRIVVLEDRLRVTDEALTETGQTTNEQINFWESEIRKLWAVTNDRNKKWIKDNEAAVVKLSKSLTALELADQEVKATLGRHESAFTQQQSMIDQLTSIEIQMQQVMRSQRDLVDKVNSAQQAVAGLQSGLTNRVRENEQAVAAIDAYRQQLNSRLADIERKLSNLAASATL